MRRESIRLVLDDNFSSGVARAQVAAKALAVSLARADATWEPHDWSDFD